jgi:hypothetical protein
MMMDEQSAYEQKRRAQLKKLDAEIQKLKAEADEAGAEAKIRLQRSVDELLAHRETLRERIDRLAEAGEDAWSDLKDGVDSAWERLEDAVENASSRFSSTDVS